MSTPQPMRAHQVLRFGTAAAHRTLDQHPLLRRLLSSDLSRERYAQSLAALHGPHLRLEQQVHQSQHHAGSGLALSARGDLLQADLLELGWTAKRVPHAPPDPLESRAAWWGRVYVLEGSRLGGAFIARRLRSSLGGFAPCRFFGALDEPGLTAALSTLRERELALDEDLEMAIASAQLAFSDYRDGLDGFDPSSSNQQ